MKRTVLIPIDQDMTPTQDDTPKEVKHMSQKYQALNAYQELKDNYSASTDWRTLKTVAVSLVPAGESMPDDLDTFIDVMVSALTTKVKNHWGVDTDHYPLFVRACPLVPRPGVLESSRADTYADVLTIARRIISTMMSPDTSDSPMYDHGFTDPHGTVMVQPFINADASAVVAPSNYILMGRDNDGITAGKDGVRVAIPIPADNKVDYDLTALDTSSDKIEIEFVSEMVEANKRTALRYSSQPTQKWAMVQLRGTEGHRPIAPAPKGVNISGTFHGAERITIKHIHLVSDNTDEQLDLMEKALREGMPEGSVVLHPNGSHLSHHAGQCFKYGVPYIASTEPQVGEQWTQAALGWVVLDNDGTYEPQPYDPLDYASDFIAGFNVGFTNFARQHGWLSNLFHQYIGGPINDPADCAHLAGAFVAWLVNATLSTGIGELRHLRSNAKNATLLPYATLTAIYGKDKWQEATGHPTLSESRQHYYMMIENQPATLSSVIDLFALAEECYALPWESSYGGAKYRESCEKGRGLAEAVQTFINTPTDEMFKELIAQANLVEHAVHNTGFFFNKFLSKTALDWGTDHNLIRIGRSDHITNLFTIFHAAKDVMDSEYREPTDFTDILTLARNTTLSSLKKKPLNQHDNVLAEAVSFLHDGQRHPNGKFSRIGEPTFIPCGVDGCDLCQHHNQHIKQQIASGVLQIAEEYEAFFPIEGGTEAKTIAAYKQMSKEDNNPKALAWLMHTHPAPKPAHKYVALMISKFSTDDMADFAKAQQEMN